MKEELRRQKDCGFAECGMRNAERLTGPLVNIPPVTDVVQIDATSVHIEFVEDAVIAHSQLEFGAALKAIVRKIVETRA
jgi:hypothetical protein